MFDARDGGPAVAEMAGITGGSFVLNGVTWHHENDVAKLRDEIDRLQERQRVEPVFHCTSHKCGSCSGCKAAGVENETARLEGELSEAKSLLGRIAEHIEFKGEGFADLPTAVWAWGGDCNRAGQSLAARHAEDDIRKLTDPYSEVNQQASAWQAIVHHPVIGPISTLPEQLGATPSLPDVKSPEVLDAYSPADLRQVVDCISDVHTRGHLAAFQEVIAHLLDTADRLEREQAAKTAQDHAIEQAAQVIHEAYGREWCDADEDSRRLSRTRAQALADAGLLNTKHGEA